jgi:hypothetical protein
MLVGVASSHDSGIRQIESITAGSRSHNRNCLGGLSKLISGTDKVSFSIKLAAFQASGWAET